MRDAEWLSIGKNIGTAMKLATMTVMIALTASAGSAQTTSTRDTATAYGARLTAKGLPAGGDQRRTSNRITNRIDNRLSLRIERYRPDSTDNPTAAFQATQNDKTRIASIPVTPQQGDE